MSTTMNPTPLRHIFLLTDLEGAAGVTHWRQTRRPGPEQDAARDLLTGEVNAVVAGLRRSAQTRSMESPRITVWDGHGTGGLHLEDLAEGVERYPYDFPGGFPGVFERAMTEGVPVDAMAFVGQHAMEGTGGNLAHTYSSRRVKRHLLNGVEIGEFGTRALHAWALGVPTLFLSGDDIACREATALVPGLVSVPVKRSLSVTEAECLSHEEACELLAASAEQILALDRQDPKIEPRFRPEAPFRYEQVRRAKWGLVPRPKRVSEGDQLVDVLAVV